MDCPVRRDDVPGEYEGAVCRCDSSATVLTNVSNNGVVFQGSIAVVVQINSASYTLGNIVCDQVLFEGGIDIREI